MSRYPSPTPKDFALVAFVVTGTLLCLFPGVLSQPLDEWTVAATTPVLFQAPYATDDDLHKAPQNMSTGVFAVIKKKMSWDEANVWCFQRKGRLADVQTRAELDTLLKSVGREESRYWTGATNHGSNGEFIWTSAGGKLVNKALFARPQDSSTRGCKENCVALKTLPKQEGLTTRACTDKFFPICKF